MSRQEASAADGQRRLEEGAIHDILRNERRRLTIRVLQATEHGQLHMRELSERVAARETNDDPTPRNKRQSVYTALHQTHVPKLNAFGVIDYDADQKMVTLQNRVSELAVYMDVSPRSGLAWGAFYFGVGLLGLLTLGAVLLGVPRIAALEVALVATVFFVLVVVAAAYHVYSQQDQIVLHRFRH